MSAPVRVTESEIEQLAAHLGLSVAPADRPAVAELLGSLLTNARLVSEFPLPDEIEAAPVFHP